MTIQISSGAERVDQLFDCLSHVRRRRLLEVVAAESTPLPVDSVIEGIAAYESEASREPTSDEIAITLTHSHLPKLQDAGIINVDDKVDVITEGDRFERAVQHLEIV